MKKIIILTLMIIWDFSLHLQELIGLPFYLYFNSRLSYTIFWTFYWGIGSILSILILKEIAELRKCQNGK